MMVKEPSKNQNQETADRGSANAAKLTPKQEVFCYEYIKDFNATRAAAAAGYRGNDATLAAVGYENLRKPQIKEFVSRHVALVAMSADEVLLRLTEHARGSLRPFYSTAGGELWPDLESDEAEQHWHLLKKNKIKRRVGGREEDQWTETEIELEIHDPQAALVHLGRHHKLFTDNTNISGKIDVEYINDWRSDDTQDD